MFPGWPTRPEKRPGNYLTTLTSVVYFHLNAKIEDPCGDYESELLPLVCFRYCLIQGVPDTLPAGLSGGSAGGGGYRRPAGRHELARPA